MSVLYEGKLNEINIYMGIDTILHSIVLSVLVLPNGFQPLHLSVLDFESSVSCNSTIRVDECLIILTGFWVVHSKVYPHPLKPQSCYSSRELLAYSCSTNNPNVAVFSNFGFGLPSGIWIHTVRILSSVSLPIGLLGDILNHLAGFSSAQSRCSVIWNFIFNF